MTNQTQSNRHDDQARVLAAASPTVTRPLRDLGGPGADRFHGHARAAPMLAADQTAWPEWWRQAVHAVELCRQAAETSARR